MTFEGVPSEKWAYALTWLTKRNLPDSLCLSSNRSLTCHAHGLQGPHATPYPYVSPVRSSGIYTRIKNRNSIRAGVTEFVFAWAIACGMKGSLGSLWIWSQSFYNSKVISNSGLFRASSTRRSQPWILSDAGRFRTFRYARIYSLCSLLGPELNWWSFIYTIESFLELEGRRNPSFFSAVSFM